MDSTISVSKGCFVFKNGATRADKTATGNKKKNNKRKHITSSVLDKSLIAQPFYSVYTETWQQLQAHIEQLQHVSYARTISELVEYVAHECNGSAEANDLAEILPAAALLTGINQPDHLEQFETLAQRIHEKIAASTCILQSRDCATLKAAVETMVYNFIEALHAEDDEDRDHKRLRRSQCTMKQLKQWYRNNYKSSTHSSDDDEVMSDDSATSQTEDVNAQRHALVVILPDFECFNAAVLQDFILILSAHCAQLPIVLILGVATAVSAVHNTLPYHVTRKIKLRVFQTQAAPLGLNELLEQVILSPKYAFHLSGKTFKFLTHIFLYYDFSINGFIQGFKYCLMEHYFQGNAYALCSTYANSLQRIQALTHDDIESIRHLLSFRPYVERINDCKRIISILTDDNYFKKKLPQLLRDCHVHFMLLRAFLEFLAALVSDLPKCLLGKQRRELYAFCLSKELSDSDELKECWQMLNFMSKSEFVAKIEKAINDTATFSVNALQQLELGSDCMLVVQSKLQAVKTLLTTVTTASMTACPTDTTAETPHVELELKQLSSRQELKTRLLQMSKQKEQQLTQYTKAVHALLDYVKDEIVSCHLTSLQRAPPLHELFVFSDIASVRRNIIGAPRAALHMALNNPYFYLQCKCCSLREQNQLLATLPDLSVAYKLHLECGRMINLYDWLQAFRAVVDVNALEDDDTAMDEQQISPQIQARFTRAIAELQFLGYIKMSKRKTDHAMRLTW